MEWPKHHLFPRAEKAFDKVAGVAVALGYLVTRHLMYEGKSEHFVPDPDVPEQISIDSFMGSSWVIHDQHDSEGRYIEPLESVKNLDKRFSGGIPGTD